MSDEEFVDMMTQLDYKLGRNQPVSKPSEEDEDYEDEEYEDPYDED